MHDVGTLLEALPYIREFHSKTVVIKYGGAAMEDPDLREEFARDVVLLKYVGLNPIVVHGGGPEITAYMERLGLPVEFVGGLRVSDEDTVEVAKMVLVGKVNKEIVLRLSRHGQAAVGLCGDDGSLFRVARRVGARRRGHRLRRAHRARERRRDRAHRKRLHTRDRLGRRGSRGTAHTTSTRTRPRAPWRARSGPTRWCSSPTCPGWLADPADPASLIGQATVEQVQDALPGLQGGMRPKLEACVDAIHAGVSAAHILDGRVAHSLLLELFTDAGIGTKIEAAA